MAWLRPGVNAELNRASGQRVWVETSGQARWGDQVLLVPSGPQNTPSSCGSYPSEEMTFPRDAPAGGTQMCNQPFFSSAGASLWIPGAFILLCALGVLTMAAAAVSARWRRV